MTQRYMWEMLKDIQGRRSLHMPGHGGNAPFPLPELFALDTTELSVTDCLYTPLSAIGEAQKAYAHSAGSACCVFLHNGSTQGNHAMLEMAAGEGDSVIVPRNCHYSVISACVLGGITPVWVPVEGYGEYAYVREETFLSVMRENPQAKAVFVTRPDYFGGCVPLEAIAEEAHRLGMKVLVDEAHGAHLPWHPEIHSASECADAWVQSVHKTLPGLTGSAVLHLKSEEDLPEVMRILRREQTSSPSFLLMLSIDDARAYMEDEGERAVRRMLDNSERIRQSLLGLGLTDPREKWAELSGYTFDRSRVVVSTGCEGKTFARITRNRGVDIEAFIGNCAILLVPVLMQDGTCEEICRIFREMPGPSVSEQEEESICAYGLAQSAMSLREAALSRAEYVELDEAEGRIAAECAGRYPPGVPDVVPGERLTKEILQGLKEAGSWHRFGTEGEKIACVAL